MERKSEGAAIFIVPRLLSGRNLRCFLQFVGLNARGILLPSEENLSYSHFMFVRGRLAVNCERVCSLQFF
jgi:hypothetical protein